VAEPYYADERVTLYGGDALTVLAALPDASVDAVITDPPYSSGGQFRGDRQASTTEKYRGWSQNPDGSRREPTAQYEDFTGDTRDQRGYLMWCSLWLAECLRVSRPGASLLMFTDWRQLPTTTDAIQSGGWVWRGIAVWDKGVGRPMRGRFRNHVEYIVWGTNGPLSDPEDIYLSSVFRHAPPRPEVREHQTQKPVGLLREFIPIVPEGGTVLDPFMGSGTTGVAAVSEGRSFAGAELTPHYQRIAQERVVAAKVGYRYDGRQEALPLTDDVA
jgi:site-specific DNA-methyltransferase (adenine-specific)